MARVRAPWCRGVVVGSLSAMLVLIVTGAAAASGSAVSIKDFAYSPTTLTVHVGDTVTWSNMEDSSSHVPHTATAADRSWNTGVIQPGSAGSVTFRTAGTFAYLCTIHPDMTGTIVVLAAAPATDTIPLGGGGVGGSATGGLLVIGLAGLLGGAIVRRRTRESSRR